MRGARLLTLVLAAAAWAAGEPGPARAQADSTATAPPAAAESTVTAAAPLRGPRIPGTALRVGDPVAVVRGRPELRALPDPDLAPGELAYGGTLRFYGSPGSAKLVFHDGGLARATLVLKRASPRTRAYVEDDLRRLGYQPSCRRAGANDRDCDWAGPLSVLVRADTAQLSFDVIAAGVTRAEASPGGRTTRSAIRDLKAVLLADSTPILPDTLDPNEDNPNGYPKPTITKSHIARIPDEMRGSVERARVVVLALVGLDGAVQYAEAAEGPEELGPIATGAVMQYRFQRYSTRAGPTRFWVRVGVFPF